MRRYESVVILDPDLPEEQIGTLTERYSQIIKSSGGELIKVEDWGSKRMAYVVKKKEKGRYILFDYVGRPALLAELERQFKISEEVMKFLSVKLDDNVDLEAFQAEAEEKAKAQAEVVSAEVPEAVEASAPAEAAAESESPAKASTESAVADEQEEGA
ncbi:MAG: 30S ribosomal protein S6 [Desulfomonile sp.]|nr:30S ribosomal protein S6 [Desulfomonile sp.]